MIQRLTLISLLIFFSLPLSAQNDGLYDYKKEFLWGINTNSHSWFLGGVSAKFSTAISERKFKTLGFELLYLRNPLEFKRQGQGGTTNNGVGRYVPNKLNHLYVIRANMGRDLLLFKKASHQGVMVNYNVSLGPSIGLLAPYYVRVNQPIGDNREQTVKLSDPGVGSSNIIRAAPFKGIFESKVLAGIHIKSSFLLEFGAYKKNLSGVELGFSSEIFSERPELMNFGEGENAPKNKLWFNSVYLTIFYGNRK